MIPFEKGETLLEKDDQIIMYTDGLTECKNDSGSFYGEKRLINLLKKAVSIPVKKSVQMIYDDLFKFAENTKPGDDITILGIQKN